MKIEIGKRYRMRNGEVTGPLEKSKDASLPFMAKCEAIVIYWRDNGLHMFDGTDHENDLVAEYRESEEDILREAFRLTGGDRQQDYGSPADNFACIAKMWSALKPGVEFTASDVAMFQICVKLGRLAHSPGHRDSVVDVAGYARCMQICNDAVKQKTD